MRILDNLGLIQAQSSKGDVILDKIISDVKSKFPFLGKKEKTLEELTDEDTDPGIVAQSEATKTNAKESDKPARANEKDKDKNKDDKKKRNSNILRVVIVLALAFFLLYDEIFPPEVVEPPAPVAKKVKPKKEPVAAEIPIEGTPPAETTEVPTEATPPADTTPTTETAPEVPVEVTATQTTPSDTTEPVTAVEPTTTPAPPLEATPPSSEIDILGDTPPTTPITPAIEPTVTDTSSIDPLATSPSESGSADTSGEAATTSSDEDMTDKILQDLEKQAKTTNAPKAQEKTEYVSPPNYEYPGRGLVYNCIGKHWACVDAPSFKTCEQNASATKFKNNKKECYPFNVYQTQSGCESMQNRMVSSSAKTAFCAE